MRLHKSFTLVLALMVAAVTLQAVPPPKSTGKVLQFASGHESIQGYLASPAGEGKYPGILAVHDSWGLSHWVKRHADQLAAEGFVVLAVDLYRGQVATDLESSIELQRTMPSDRAFRDLAAALDKLRELDTVRADQLGAVGWSMGGDLVLDLAGKAELQAIVLCYPQVAAEDERLPAVKAPILGLFGAEDLSISTRDVRGFEATAKALGKEIEIHIYDAMGHSFMRADKDIGSNYIPRMAWTEMNDFFRDNLKE